MWSVVCVVTALISPDNIRRLIEIRWSQLSCLPQLIYDKTNARNASWILMYYFHRKYHSRESQFRPVFFTVCREDFLKNLPWGISGNGCSQGRFLKNLPGEKNLSRKLFRDHPKLAKFAPKGAKFLGSKNLL